MTELVPAPERRRHDDKLPHPHDEFEACPGGCEDIKSVDQRLDDGDARMNRIEEKINITASEVAEVLDIIRMGKSFFKFAGYMGTFIQWVLVISAPAVALYFTIKNGRAP